LTTIAIIACERSTTPHTLVAESVPSPSAALRVPAAPCPDDMVLVDMPHGEGSVCIDRYEASIDGQLFSHAPDATSALHALSIKGVKPQVNINADEAEAACRGAAKRLCTETEWTAACRGPQGLTYPYGNDHRDGACNDGRARPPAAAREHLDDPSLAEAPDTIAMTGSFPQCVSASGSFDMHGNVEEWVSGSPGDDPRFGIFMGGYFAEASANGWGCGYKTTAHIKTYRDYSIGFRCCKAPTP